MAHLDGPAAHIETIPNEPLTTRESQHDSIRNLNYKQQKKVLNWRENYLISVIQTIIW